MRLALVVLSGLVLALAADSATAGAASGPPVQITFGVFLTFTSPLDHPPCVPTTPCTAAGTFSDASAPMCPSGSASDSYVFPGGQRDRRYVCADGSGSLTMSVQYRRFFPGPTPDTLLITGYWEITGGTGLMAQLHGQGHVTSIFTPGVNGSLVETNSGDVVVAH
jgi:hypothetical protein